MDNKKQRLLTIEEAASFLGLKVSRIRTAVFRRELPFLKVGRLIRFDPLDIEGWIASLRKGVKE